MRSNENNVTNFCRFDHLLLALCWIVKDDKEKECHDGGMGKPLNLDLLLPNPGQSSRLVAVDTHLLPGLLLQCIQPGTSQAMACEGY